MQIAPPLLPLSKAAFTAALKTGHGRALQHLASHGSTGLEDQIIEACMTCLSYDPQCEAPRAPWLFSVVDQAGLNEEVIQAIQAAKDKPAPENQRDFEQRSAILKELAASGSSDAHRLLYLSLVRVPDTSSVIGADDIVALDGIAGLQHVAKQIGRWLLEDPDFWIDDGLLRHVDEEAGLEALKREAIADFETAKYVVEVEKIREPRSSSTMRSDARTFTATEIINHVRNNPKDKCYWFRQWGAQASASQHEAVFEELLKTEQPEHAKRLFRCFSKIGIPRFDSRLLQWIDHPDEELQWIAVKVLASFTHDELRQAARRLIANGDLANGIALLVNNFAEGDFSMCADQMVMSEDSDETHHLVGSLLDLCESHPGAGALDCLLYVYEFSPCSTCRKRAVKALASSNTMPSWVLAESIFDAVPETRTLVREIRPYGPGSSTKASS